MVPDFSNVQALDASVYRHVKDPSSIQLSTQGQERPATPIGCRGAPCTSLSGRDDSGTPITIRRRPRRTGTRALRGQSRD